MPYECSECQNVFDAEEMQSEKAFPGSREEPEEWANYCPHCGAEEPQYISWEEYSDKILTEVEAEGLEDTDLLG